MKRFLIDFILVYLIFHIAISYKNQNEFDLPYKSTNINSDNIACVLADKCSEGIYYLMLKCINLFEATYSIL